MEGKTNILGGMGSLHQHACPSPKLLKYLEVVTQDTGSIGEKNPKTCLFPQNTEMSRLHHVVLRLCQLNLGWKHIGTSESHLGSKDEKEEQHRRK